jgi:pilus assembly protein Flp/PilA
MATAMVSQFYCWLSFNHAGPHQEQLGEPKMKNMTQLLKNLMTEESGQDLIEYALVAALVGLGAVASMQGLANSIATAFNGVGTALSNA